MDKYDYITATIDEEKIRLEKIISYLKGEGSDELPEYQERYNNILKYLNTKKEYLNIENNIKDDKKKLEELNKTKAEYEVDNILLEDTLLSNFHKDTNNEYRNLLFENIKYEKEKDILSLLFIKQSDYTKLVIKRNKLISKMDKNKYPNTYSTLINQNVIIEKQNNILDEIYLLENGIKSEKEKQRKLENSIITEPILKLLYEFWIIDTYDERKVDRNKLFKDNRFLVNIKYDITEVKEDVIVTNEENEAVLIPNLNLPGLNEDTLIDIDGKNYIKNDK